MMESGRLPENKKFNIYTESDRNCVGDWEKYDAVSDVAAEAREASGLKSHAGSDFYPTHCFIEKILGKEDGQWSVDVYMAVDMGICGILAYRSVLGGNIPINVPNLRNKEERDAYRNDNACTTPEVAGDALLPRTSHTEYIKEIPDEVYEHVRQLWLEGKKA